MFYLSLINYQYSVVSGFRYVTLQVIIIPDNEKQMEYTCNKEIQKYVYHGNLKLIIHEMEI